jgi:hypothetical protein
MECNITSALLPFAPLSAHFARTAVFPKNYSLELAKGFEPLTL